MALKARVIIFALFLLTIAKVSSNVEEPHMEIARTPAPLIAPAPAPAPVHYMTPINTKECPRLCGDRCKLNSRPRHCNRVCCTCCVRCKCVPPGTAGNRELCGKCYTDMTTHGNMTKCP